MSRPLLCFESWWTGKEVRNFPTILAIFIYMCNVHQTPNKEDKRLFFIPFYYCDGCFFIPKRMKEIEYEFHFAYSVFTILNPDRGVFNQLDQLSKQLLYAFGVVEREIYLLYLQILRN